MIDLLISWLLARLLAQSFRRDATHTASVYPCRSLYPPPFLPCSRFKIDMRYYGNVCDNFDADDAMPPLVCERLRSCGQRKDSFASRTPPRSSGELILPFFGTKKFFFFFLLLETTKRVPMEAMLHYCPSHGKGRHIRSVCKLPPVC